MNIFRGVLRLARKRVANVRPTHYGHVEQEYPQGVVVGKKADGLYAYMVAKGVMGSC